MPGVNIKFDGHIPATSNPDAQKERVAQFDFDQAVDGPKTTRNDNVEFKPLQFHFHMPSENTLNGTALDAEVHLVNLSAEGNLAVFGIWFAEATEGTAAGDELLQAVVKAHDANEVQPLQ